MPPAAARVRPSRRVHASGTPRTGPCSREAVRSGWRRGDGAVRNSGGPATAITSENSWAIITICRNPGPLGPALPSCNRPMNWGHISSNLAPGRASTSMRTSSSPTGRHPCLVFGGAYRVSPGPRTLSPSPGDQALTFPRMTVTVSNTSGWTWRGRRAPSTHVQVGNKLTTIRFGRTHPHHKALVWMLIDLSGPHRHHDHPLLLAAWLRASPTMVKLICVTADGCCETAGSGTIEVGPFYHQCPNSWLRRSLNRSKILDVTVAGL